MHPIGDDNDDGVDDGESFSLALNLWCFVARGIPDQAFSPTET